MAPDLNVTVLNRQRGHRVPKRALESFVCKVAELMPPESSGELTVCLLSDRRMRELNRSYRGRDTPTDVLSFPGEESPAPDGSRQLGDIAIAVPTAARQARERGHTLARELKLLALHGYLHLLGFDHERDGGRMMRAQRRLERALLARRKRVTVGGRG